jgi:hypothetical protein
MAMITAVQHAHMNNKQHQLTMMKEKCVDIGEIGHVRRNGNLGTALRNYSELRVLRTSTHHKSQNSANKKHRNKSTKIKSIHHTYTYGSNNSIRRLGHRKAKMS